MFIGESTTRGDPCTLYRLCLQPIALREQVDPSRRDSFTLPITRLTIVGGNGLSYDART
jgi:hypothetical protein